MPRLETGERRRDTAIVSVGWDEPFTARRRIPPKALVLVAAALALAALVVAAAGVVWLRTYAPMRMAGTSGPGPGSLDLMVVRDSEEFAGRTAYVVSGATAGRFGIVFDVTNTGRLPVVIEGLGGDGEADSLLPALKLRRAERGGGRFYDFYPEKLGSGESTFLGLEVIAMRPCEKYVPGSSIGWDSVTLRYSYARFFEREETIELPVAMSLEC